MRNYDDWLDELLEKTEVIAAWQEDRDEAWVKGEDFWTCQPMLRIWLNSIIEVSLPMTIRILLDKTMTKVQIARCFDFPMDRITMVEQLMEHLQHGTPSDEQLTEKLDIPVEIIQLVKQTLAEEAEGTDNKDENA